jgi:hypothetical protein
MTTGDRIVPFSRLARLAWLPIPLLLVAMAALWIADLQATYESRLVLAIYNFLCSTLASLLVAILVGRSYFVRGSSGLLLLGCGAVFWGAAGSLSPFLLSRGTNALISGHNVLVWLSALCHLAGVILIREPRQPHRLPGLMLAVAYSGSLCLVWLVTMLAVEGWMPLFFVQGQGGTPVRQLVLGSAIAMFVFTTTWLWRVNRSPRTAFVRWYGLALALVATGLLGVMIQSAHGSLVGWTGRAAQFLGGSYMVVAAAASVRESGAWTVALSAALRASEFKYRVLFQNMTEGFALYELLYDEAGQAADWQILDVNDAYTRHTGAAREQIVGRRISEVFQAAIPTYLPLCGGCCHAGFGGL